MRLVESSILKDLDLKHIKYILNKNIKEILNMSRCTAPVHGHRTQSGRANCPACGGGYSPRYSLNNQFLSSSTSGFHTISRGTNQYKTKARWASPNSTILYTPTEIRTLTPVRENVEKRQIAPESYDVFLCHAWDDRKGIAKELYDFLKSKGVRTWFSEIDVSLGTSLLREIDKGLAKSRVGIVLVTPSFIERINGEGIADKELSALLARDLLVPVLHNTTFEDLREISPLLGSRSGLSTIEETIENIASKIQELVTVYSI